jgi:hypothetical protein
MFASVINKTFLEMKRILIVFAVIALVFSVVSCKKCITCKYEYVQLGDTVKESEGSCGKSSELNDFKDAKLSEAQLHGINEITCTTDK